MAVQFNLLPEVKLAFIKAERQKRVVVTIATFATIISIVALVLFVLVIRVFQQNKMNDLGEKVQAVTNQIKNEKDINKILTVQNQVKALDELHAKKPVGTRLFGYLTQIIPNNASISSLKVDYSTNTLDITGSVADLATVQKFADALKLTTYTVAGDDTTNKEKPAAFANVVLSTIGRDKEKATYSIKLSFDPVLFQQDKAVTLVVPSITNTTGPDVNRPTALFQPAPTEGQ